MIDELNVEDLGSAWSGNPVTLRRVLVHMVEETARHAGHMDLLRELLDRRTGEHRQAHGAPGGGPSRAARRGTCDAVGVSLSHAIVPMHEAAQQFQARSLLGAIGAGVLVVILIIFLIGLLIGLLVGFFVGRAVGRR